MGSLEYALPNMAFAPLPSNHAYNIYFPLNGASRVSFYYYKNHYGNALCKIYYENGTEDVLINVGRGAYAQSFDVEFQKPAKQILFYMGIDTTCPSFGIHSFTVS